MKRLFVILASFAVLVGGSHAQLVVKNTGGTELMTVNNSGDVMMETLKGSGTRMVVADASGNLSTQTIPSGGGADGVVTGGSVSGTSTKTITLTRSNSLTDVTFTFSDAVDDADHSTSNEIQTLSKSGNTVSLSRGGGSFTDAVNDADHSTSNELQNLNQVLSRGNDANQQNAVNFRRIGIGTNSPEALLQIKGQPSSANGLWPTINGTANPGYARLHVPVEQQLNGMNVGVLSYIPIAVRGSNQAARAVTGNVYVPSGNNKLGVAAGTLGRTGGNSSSYDEDYDLIAGVSGQIYGQHPHADYHTFGGYFENSNSSGENYGIYVDAKQNKIVGDIDITGSIEAGTGDNTLLLWSCKGSAAGIVVIGSDQAAAVANCRRVQSSAPNSANLLPITVNF